jgi:hypothetical protein
MKGVIGGTDERGAIQSVASTLLRKRSDFVFMGHVIRRRGDEKVLVAILMEKNDKVLATTWLVE